MKKEREREKEKRNDEEEMTERSSRPKTAQSEAFGLIPPHVAEWDSSDYYIILFLYCFFFIK